MAGSADDSSLEPLTEESMKKLLDGFDKNSIAPVRTMVEHLYTRIGTVEKALESLRHRAENDRFDFEKRFEKLRSAYIVPPGHAHPKMFAEDRPTHPGRSLLD